MFSASRRACSEISFFVLFLFAICLEDLSDSAYVNYEIGQRSEDTQHLRAIDQRLRVVGARHANIVATRVSDSKMAEMSSLRAPISEPMLDG
jgi:hypothetical protein